MRCFVLVCVLVLAGCGSDDGGDDNATGGGETVPLSAVDFKFDPADVEVDTAGETTFTLANDGQSEHALEIEGNGIEEETDEVSPGESATLTVDLKPGEYEFYCPVDDHRERGMEGTLVVGGGGSSGAGTSTGESDTETDGGYGG